MWTRKEVLCTRPPSLLSPATANQEPQTLSHWPPSPICAHRARVQSIGLVWPPLAPCETDLTSAGAWFASMLG